MRSFLNGSCGLCGVVTKWRITLWNSGSFVGSGLSLMTDAFHSPRSTLNRAQYHIRDFSAIVRNFVKSDPWSRFVDKDSQPGEDIYKIKFTQQMPEILPCILFDAAKNLRAVLDQTAYASAIVAGSPSLKAIKFPFGPTEKDWRNDLAGGCKDLPSKIRAVFERFKSYKTGNETLWALNEIANAQKHFALIPIAIVNPIANFFAEAVHELGTTTIRNFGSDALGWNAEKGEMTLFSVPKGVETQSSKPAVDVLNAMSGIVESVLMATEAECRHLGFIT
jgi:hypothetical protein